jgi:hypothetical protein
LIFSTRLSMFSIIIRQSMNFVQPFRASTRIGPAVGDSQASRNQKVVSGRVKSRARTPGARGETNFHFFPVQ